MNTISDNGAVHINSVIQNRDYYLTAKDLGGYAWEKAGKIWYIALTERLRESSNFQNAANNTYEVARTLYGQSSNEQNAVKKAWDQVGIKIKPMK